MDGVRTIVEEVFSALGATVTSLQLITVDAQHTFEITIDNGDMYVGEDGEKMKALDMLVRMIAEKKGHLERFHIDINGYHKAEVVRIQNSAKVFAEQVRIAKVDMVLLPMRPYERMLIHAALTNEPHITTESAGLGRDRHVVIKYTP
jgi:spoIIIJ-associated protein